MARNKKFNGKVLRALRKEAGFTQALLAMRVGISRETVSAIENEKPETMDVLGADIIQKWYSVCAASASQQVKAEYYRYVMDYFKVPLAFVKSLLG